MTDLVSGHRTTQIAHRPSSGEDFCRILPGPSEHEFAFAQAGDRGIDGGDVNAATGGRETIEQALFVTIGLEPTDHPRAGVRERLVVDVDRVLCGEHHTDSEGASLLHQGHDGLLGRRVGRWWEIAGHFVHVEQRPQIGRTRLTAHPGDQLRQDQRRDELTLLVTQVSGRDDRAAALAVGGVEHRVDVERDPSTPRRKRRRGEQAVKFHRELHAVGRREELIEFEHAEFADRWVADEADERGEVECSTFGPGVVDQVRQQDVLAARQRVGFHADQAQQAGYVTFDFVADHLGVAHVGWNLQRSNDVDRGSRLRTGGVDREVGLRT